MLEIIKPRTSRQVVEYSIEFTDEDLAGFSFPADSSGNIRYDADPELARMQRANYNYALSKKDRFTRQYNEFVTQKRTVTEEAIGRCRCGEEFEMYYRYQGACPCPKCGQWYNLFGQELIDPEYWEDDGDY